MVLFQQVSLYLGKDKTSTHKAFLSNLLFIFIFFNQSTHEEWSGKKLLPHKVVQSKRKYVFHNKTDTENKNLTLLPKILSKHCVGANSSGKSLASLWSNISVLTV